MWHSQQRVDLPSDINAHNANVSVAHRRQVDVRDVRLTVPTKCGCNDIIPEIARRRGYEIAFGIPGVDENPVDFVRREEAALLVGWARCDFVEWIRCRRRRVCEIPTSATQQAAAIPASARQVPKLP